MDMARCVYAAHPGDRHYTLGLNVFADRTTNEVCDAYSCDMAVDGGRGAPAAEGKDELPDSIDWRTADHHDHPCVT